MPARGGILVGSSLTQRASAEASQGWMIRRENRGSPFWQFIERFSPDRMDIAWTNVSKMDRNGVNSDQAGPPTKSQWSIIAEPCLRALSEEIDSLEPAVTILCASAFRSDLENY